MLRTRPYSFRQLCDLAEHEIHTVLRELPVRLQDAVSRVTILLEDIPTSQWLKEGVEPDQLGLFEGVGAEDPAHYQVPRIVLWVGNIWEASGDDLEAYLEEVRITFLHELGHYLGLSEEDLIERDLG